MSEFALMDSGSRPDVGHITRFSPPLLSDDASQRQVSGESATSSDDLWSVGRSPGSSHTSSSASLGPSRVDLSEQWRAHVTLAEFTQNLGHALKTLFPNQNRSRYKNVHVLLMRWEHGDPLLRVFEEMDELRRVFEDIFHFQVEIFEIPEEDSHAAVGQKVMDFSRYNGNSTDDLKIFYYAGHSRSNKSKNLLFTSSRGENSRHYKQSTVTWSGIQSTLEQSASDVLIILDCCEAGRGNIGDGNGVTELIAACNYKAIANGVGIFSFTNHLITELRLLSATRRSFTVAELYDHIYNRMQSHLEQGIKNERYPAPIHLFLTRDYDLHRSIELTPLTNPESGSHSAPRGIDNRHLNQAYTNKRPRSPERGDLSKKRARPWRPTPSPNVPNQGASTKQLIPATSTPRNLPYGHPRENRPPENRTMLFAVRLDETATTESLVLEAFKEWFRGIPASVRDVSCSLEGQFLCDSSLVLLRVPIAVWACLKDDPAIMCLGPVRSSNLLSSTKKLGVECDTGPQIQKARSPNSKKKVAFAIDDSLETIQDVPSPTRSVYEMENQEPAELPNQVIFEAPRKREELVGFAVSGPAEIYVRNISDKYPHAETELVGRLGQANWERHVKVRKALDHAAEQENPSSAPEPSLFKPSSLRDSGLGTSIGDNELRAYEPSLATSFASRFGDADINHFRVPPMPAHAPGRAGFTCPYCSRYLLTVENRRDWKRHVFQDISPYICTISGCKEALLTFSSRLEWAQHELREHFLEHAQAIEPADEASRLPNSSVTLSAQYGDIRLVSLEDGRLKQTFRAVTCKLCRKVLTGAKGYVSHVAKHLESIALAAIPQASEGDSGDEQPVAGTASDPESMVDATHVHPVSADGQNQSTLIDLDLDFRSSMAGSECSFIEALSPSSPSESVIGNLYFATADGGLRYLEPSRQIPEVKKSRICTDSDIDERKVTAPAADIEAGPPRLPTRHKQVPVAVRYNMERRATRTPGHWSSN